MKLLYCFKRVPGFAALAIICPGLVSFTLPCAQAASCTQLQWQTLYPVQAPPGRQDHAMAYDASRSAIILFGGRDTNNIVLGDTWKFDVHGWTQLAPAYSPAARYGHTLSYDASRGTIILFGGWDGASLYADTWEWNGTDWVSIAAGTSPAPRFRHGMTYDSTRAVHVLFGGTGSEDYGDTWEYNGNLGTWTLRSTTGPATRFGCQLAFDTPRNLTLLFGGYNSLGVILPDKYLNDTWVWDGGSGVWTWKTPSTVPQGRAFYSMAYFGAHATVLMQNGEIAFDATHTAEVRESWEWNGSDWVDNSQAYGFCCPREHGAMAYDQAHDRMIQYGGYGYARDGTWSLDPIWLWSQAIQVDPPFAGHPGYVATVRQALDAVGDCSSIAIRYGNYNETGSGNNPLVITKAVRLSAYRLAGDPVTGARVH
jgi:hypothetical protein